LDQLKDELVYMRQGMKQTLLKGMFSR